MSFRPDQKMPVARTEKKLVNAALFAQKNMTDTKAKTQVPGTSLEYLILLYVESEIHRSPQLCAEYTPVHQFRTRPECENSDKTFLNKVGIQSFHQTASNLPLLSKQKPVLLAHEIRSFKIFQASFKKKKLYVSLIFPSETADSPDPWGSGASVLQH